MEFKHYSIMYSEVLEGLNIKPDGIYVDGTLGGAGHARGVCEKLNKNGTFIGIDRDEDAIKVSAERLAAFLPEIHVVHGNYGEFRNILEKYNIDKVDGMLLDLGVSSYQFDNPERGFSYRFDAELDMRMDRSSDLSALQVVNEYSKEELARIIREYGEDRFANNIAKHIVLEREKKKIETTHELSEIICESIPMKLRKKGGHPAKKTFQALRIEVNGELDVLENTINSMIDSLSPGGRLCIITFHSLEDRIVKNAFKNAANPPCTCPPDLPVCVCGRKSKGNLVTRKPIMPRESEIEENPRSKSAKLRIFEHI
ncbi:MAG: 16S rRNA (cytosine(1402)-N(4))-methyltransferase RsmH [Lachnospiraceae bacterium]|nr:16S rRNA (cytosine(1402)-N(4))-methyltransferase RsmH [Lachnospiraceae bacterium]